MAVLKYFKHHKDYDYVCENMGSYSPGQTKD